MTGQVLVAGATGAVGQYVVQDLLVRGHSVRALVHRTPLSQHLQSRVSVVEGDALDPESTDAACADCEIVFSSLGASVSPRFSAGRRTYGQVDTPANLNLLRAAVRRGARRFVYVSVAGQDQLGHTRYVQAHETVVEALRAADIDHAVVRPPGFFSAFREVLDLARKGRVPIIGDGSARTNPIHDTDLAKVCVDAIEGAGPEILAGGPDVLTRRDIATLALETLGRPPKVRHIPPGLVHLMAGLVRPLNPRVADISAFYADASVLDLVTPARGKLRLRDYFEGEVV